MLRFQRSTYYCLKIVLKERFSYYQRVLNRFAAQWHLELITEVAAHDPSLVTPDGHSSS
jgi:hypothetical protein